MEYDWDKIARELSEFVDVQREKPLAEMTSFGVGGPARVVVQPIDSEEMRAVFDYLWETQLPYFIIGNGTNLLVSDRGFDGVVIAASYDLGQIVHKGGNRWVWGAGVSLWRGINRAAGRGFGGLEPLAGIPGSVGGAVVMNAGAYGKSFFDVVRSVELLLPGEGYVSLSPEQLEPDYRGAKIPEGALVSAVELELDPKNPAEIKGEITEYISRRARTQPINEKSAGCVFRNPPGLHAGKLIDEAGLKGYSIGGAQVSPVHANFIVNRGGATAEDIVALIRLVRQTVKEKFGVELELEIKTLGFDEEI